MFRLLWRWLRERRFLGAGIFQVALVAVGLNLFFAVAYYFVEGKVNPDLGFADAMWWAIVTMTTVGYGDLYPQSHMGRWLVAYPCMLVGIGLIGYLLSLVTEFIIEQASRARKGTGRVTFDNHILICCYPGEETLASLISEIHSHPHYSGARIVLVADVIDELPERFKTRVRFIKGDPSDTKVLDRANIDDAVGVFIVPGDQPDDKAVTVCAQVRASLGDKADACRIVARLKSSSLENLLMNQGIDGVVAEDGLEDKLLVQEFLYPGVSGIVRSLLTNTEGQQLYLFPTTLAGKDLHEVQKAVLDHEAEVQVLGVMRGGERHINPGKGFVLEAGDNVITLARSPESYEQFERDVAAG